jgi:hypothetical protein
VKAVAGFIKVKQLGQAQAGAVWNKHVNKLEKRTGNKVIRREERRDIESRSLER